MEINEDLNINKYNHNTFNNSESKAKIINMNNKCVFHKYENIKKLTYITNKKIVNFLMYHLILIINIIHILSDNINIYTINTGSLYVHNIDGHYISNSLDSYQPYPYPNKTVRFEIDNSKYISIGLYNNLKNASKMFKNGSNIAKIEFSISSSSTIKIEDTSEMFENCISLQEIIFGNLATSNVVNMSRMFYNCSSLPKINFNKQFITNKVVDMSYMFYNCRNLSEIKLANFDTSIVADMNHMF